MSFMFFGTTAVSITALIEEEEAPARGKNAVKEQLVESMPNATQREEEKKPDAVPVQERTPGRLTQSVEWVKVKPYAEQQQQQQQQQQEEKDEGQSAQQSESIACKSEEEGNAYTRYVSSQVKTLCDSVAKVPRETVAYAATGLLLGVVAGVVVYSQHSTISSLEVNNTDLKDEISTVRSQVSWKK